MGAALRISTSEQVQHSYFRLRPHFEFEGLTSFSVSYKTSTLSQDELSCWTSLFTNPVITQGFPVPIRHNDEQGLEISLEMMAALGGARHMTQYDGGLVLKGHSAMMVPIKLHQDSIEWHFIHGDEEQQVPYRKIREWKADHISLRIIDFESLGNRRTFLGWWHSAETHLETADADYESIGWSSAAEPHRAIKVSGAEVGFQSMFTSKASFIMGAKDGRLHFAREGPFPKIVLYAEKTQVVLYDLEDCRAWFVPALDVMLHVIQTRHPLSFYTTGGQDVELMATNPGKIDGSAARDAAFANQRRLLYDGYHFEDAMLDIWSKMERLKEKDDFMEASPGVALHATLRRKLQGWEYMSLVYEKNYRRKVANIAKSSGGWVDLVADIDTLVLFATGFKEIIKPIHNLELCCRWRDLPKGKDYLATSVPVLQLLYSEAGSKVSQKHLSTNRLRWHRGAVLFEKCANVTSSRCSCDRTQQIYHDSYFKTVGHRRTPGTLEKNGCVIFGQAHHPLKPAMIFPTRENAVHSLPNFPIHGLEALPSIQEPGAQVLPTRSAPDVDVEDTFDEMSETSDLETPCSNILPSNRIGPKQSTIRTTFKSPVIEAPDLKNSYKVKSAKNTDDVSSSSALKNGSRKNENSIPKHGGVEFDSKRATIPTPNPPGHVPRPKVCNHRFGCLCTYCRSGDT